MKNKFRIIAIVLLMAIIFVALAPVGFADVGDFSGDSDYGGGYDGGSSSDWSSSDSSWDSSGGSGGSGGSINSGNMIFIIIFIGVMVYVYISSTNRGNRSRGPVNMDTGRNIPVDRSLTPMSAYTSKDPNFSAGAMTEKIGNMYIRMQHAWTAKNWESMRPLFSDALYNQLAHQINQYIQKGQTNYVDRIAVLSVTLNGWKSDGENDHIVARIKTRIIDYVLDDSTGKLVRGNRTAERFMTYEWTLSRSAASATAAVSGDAATTQHCPTCGAVIDVNQTARCPYCQNVLQASSHDWVISNMEGISQQTL